MRDVLNNPTRAGLTAPSSGPTLLSGSEVQDLCMKAARGAGLSWGMAEEAGYAARWLFARGWDGPQALLDHLHASQDTEATSPIILGTAMSDSILLSPPQSSKKPVHKPLLLLPFMHLAAGALGKSLVLSWDAKSVAVTPEGKLTGLLTDLVATDTVDVTFAISDGCSETGFKVGTLSTLAQKTVTGLNAFAMETTVPASDASRAGAGSGAGDND